MSELHADVQQAEALMGGDEPPMPKLCIDCMYCMMIVKTSLTDSIRDFFCENTHAITIDPVDGSKKDNGCWRVRHAEGKCGPEGKYWKSKYVQEI